MAYYNSNSSISYNSINASIYEEEEEENNMERQPQPPFRSSSFPIRNNKKKKKHHIAPFPPTPPKVYNVDPLHFRDVVQNLTGYHDYQLTRLQEVAPPQLSLNQHAELSSFPTGFMENDKQWKSFESTFDELSPFGFSLSPSSIEWCSSILMSPPGTASSNLEPRHSM